MHHTLCCFRFRIRKRAKSLLLSVSGRNRAGRGRGSRVSNGIRGGSSRGGQFASSHKLRQCRFDALLLHLFVDLLLATLHQSHPFRFGRCLAKKTPTLHARYLLRFKLFHSGTRRFEASTNDIASVRSLSRGRHDGTHASRSTRCHGHNKTSSGGNL